MIYLFTKKFNNEYRHYVLNDNMIYRTTFSKSMDLPKNTRLFSYVACENGKVADSAPSIYSHCIWSDFFMNNCDLRIISTYNDISTLCEIIDEKIFNI